MKWMAIKPEFALTLPLGILCAALAVFLVLESFVFQRSITGGAPPSGTSGQEKLPGDLEPEEVFELPEVDGFSAFVDRPLFIEGRKAPPPEAEQAQTTQEKDATPLSLLLMGVMLSPRGEMAILSEATGKNRRVKKGGTINGWRLVEIKPDRATLQRGEERKELVLLKPKPKVAGATGGPGRAPTPGAPPPGARRASQPPVVPPPEINEPEVEEPEEAGDTEDPDMSDVAE